MSKSTTPLLFPSEYNNLENKVINKPQFEVGMIYVKEGDKIKKGQNLLELHLIEPKEQVLKQPLYFTITNESGQEGWLAELRVKKGDIVLPSEEFLILDKLKETKKINNSNSLSKNEKNYSWSINEKLKTISNRFVDKLNKNFSEIIVNQENEILKSQSEQFNKLKESLNPNYNLFENLLINQTYVPSNYNYTQPKFLPLGSFPKDHLIKQNLICLQEFPYGNILVEYNKNSSQFLHDYLIQTISISLESLDPRLIQVRGISFDDFGSSLNLLGNFDEKFLKKVCTDDEDLMSLSEELEQRIIEVRKKCLKSYDNLFDYNASNAKNPFAYYFVFCTINKSFSDESRKILNKFISSNTLKNAGIFFYVFSNDIKNIVGDFELEIKAQNVSKKTADVFIIAKDNNSILNNRLLKIDLLSKKVLTSIVNNINSKDVSINLDPFIETKNQWFKSKSNEGLKVPVGYGSDKKLDLVIGHGTPNYNVLIGGGVGSGKSVLLHNIILGISTKYSVDECQFLLLDYKEGTEFQPYENLPHAHVLSTESDTSFGLKTLEFINTEITKRGDLFKKYGVSNIKDLKDKKKIKLPRWCVIIDEFQRMLQYDTVGLKSSALFDDLLRRGRAFGIHFILATQSIIDLNLTAATLSQLSVRICLRISEMDAAKILHSDNLVPSTFENPGMAIYNDNIGLINANEQVQVPFINTEKILNTIKSIKSLNKIKTENYIYKGQDFEIFDPSKVVSKQKSNICFGALQDIKRNYHFLSLNPQMYNPILIVGNDNEKKKLILKSFYRNYLTDSKSYKIECFDFHPLKSQYLTDLIPNNKKKYVYIDQKDIILERLETINSKKSKPIQISLFIGLDKLLEFKEKYTDDSGTIKNNNVKDLILNIINKRLALNIMPILFIDKINTFTETFESVSLEINSVTPDIYSRRIFMDTPGVDIVDIGRLGKNKIVYYDNENIIKQPLTLFK